MAKDENRSPLPEGVQILGEQKKEKKKKKKKKKKEK